MLETGSRSRRIQFITLYTIGQVSAVLSLAFMLYWITKYLNGFQWSDPFSRFNWHTLLMSIGLIYTSGSGLLCYRLLLSLTKKRAKIIHATLMAVSTLFSLFGIFVILHFYYETKLNQFYSIHSWLGATVVITFAVQWMVSYYCFLYPGASDTIRSKLLQLHIPLGSILFMLSVVCCLTGLTEKAMFDRTYKYNQFTGATFTVNFTAIFMVIYATIVLYLTTKVEFKRSANLVKSSERKKRTEIIELRVEGQ